MRLVAGLIVMLATACAPVVDPRPAFDEDLGPPQRAAPVQNVAVEQAPRPEAPPGKGLRSGTIARATLVGVLDGGPGAFLRTLEVAPHMDGERFVGWQLVQLLDRTGPLVDVDVVPGDILLAINGKPIARPDQLQAVWDSLRTAKSVDAVLWRGDKKVSLQFAVAD
jgi:S1-C subfamily serine protease